MYANENSEQDTETMSGSELKPYTREEVTTVVVSELVEDEPIESMFTVAEVWQQVPYHVWKEILSHMDLRICQSLCRYSTVDWQ